MKNNKQKLTLIPKPKVKLPINKNNLEEKANNAYKAVNYLTEAQNKGISYSEIKKLIAERKDTTEQILHESVTKLYNNESIADLLLITRLSDELSYYIVKHLIVLNFFVEYWQHIKVEIQIIKTKKLIKNKYHMVYRRKITYLDSGITDKTKESYEKLIKELLSVPISHEGKSRNELTSIIQALLGRILQQEQIEKGNLKQYGI